MTHQITFSPEFMDSYNGTPDQLNQIMNKISTHINSGGDLSELASSITFGGDQFEKVFSITI